MSKKILILNGSPRPKGNTAVLIDSFVKGAVASGNSVTRFDLEKMDIHPCLGCLSGGKDPKSPCVQKDAMDEIYPVFQEAEVVVFACPMYFWSFTAQLKACVDRLFAVMESDLQSSSGKECILLMPAEEDSEKNFAPVVSYYQTLAENLGWKDVGMILAGGVMEVGDISGKPVLLEAEALGRSVV
ncbi:flavodoxin family protein [Methanorbis rubei]|uniref:FMN-dependent NADH-azoreductase n=1 Tax=Methanorbis rubei TaxID=3028300 RepID=A0AAE4MEV5_9EURY|nr:FMN-dependent NADH-azoreductase [Methanocorpusculaceae archaeon Cs1]